MANLTRDSCLDGLEHPYATGWKLWRQSLPVLAIYAAAPAALLAAFVTPITRDWSNPETPATGWELVLLAVLFGAIVITAAAVVSITYTRGDAAAAPAVAARRFLSWAVTVIAVGSVVFVGYLLFVIPGIYLALRLFWADEFALIHDQNPFEAIRSSWRLTQGAMGEVFSFQFKLGCFHLVVWLPAMVIVIVAVNLLDASGLAPAISTPIGLAVAAFVFTLAYGFTHACEVAYFCGLRADYEIFADEQVQEGLPAPPSLRVEQLAVGDESAPDASTYSEPDPRQPRCPSCGSPYNADDYRDDVEVAQCSHCRAELQLKRR